MAIPPAKRPLVRKLVDPRLGRSVVMSGAPRRLTGDLYHVFLEAPWPILLATFAAYYAVANALFALAYLAGGDDLATAHPGSFPDAFFFSVQTMATIGYGEMVPQGLYANVLMTIEVLVGLVALAMVTGLTFAKFSRPTARVLFSRYAVIAPHDGVPSLMFRMANVRGNNVIEAEVHVVLARDETTAEGDSMRRFHDLDLLRRRSALFALSWTAIHPLTDRSPLHGATGAALEAAEAEIIVSLMGFDEQFSQTVHARHHYRSADIVWGARFADILVGTASGGRRIDYGRFHEVVPLPREAARTGPTRAPSRR